MMSANELTAFLGWAFVINLVIIFLTSLLLILVGERISAFHAKLFSLDKKDLKLIYLQHLAQYRTAIIVLNLVPYIALKIMA